MLECPKCGGSAKVYCTSTTPQGKRRYHRCTSCQTTLVSLNNEYVKPADRMHNAKLDPDKVREMRAMAASGVSSMECALAFDVNQKTAWMAINGHNWAHVA